MRIPCMHNVRRLVLVPSMLLLITLSSCYDAILAGVNKLPEQPVNLASINSPFDDYNSAYPPTIGDTFPFYFSSNRRAGHDFDIIPAILDIKMDRSDGILIAGENTTMRFGTWSSPYSGRDLTTALEMINTTTADELGPYIIRHGSAYYRSSTQRYYDGYMILYASNQAPSGAKKDLDIYFTHNVWTSSGEFIQPLPIRFLNTPADDAYPTLTPDTTALYFCSNRGGNFDIYSSSLKGSFLLDKLTSTEIPIVQKDTILSSEYDDKCPFIEGNMLVFTSNRPGGFGGYDLYYSLWNETGKHWSAPKNFGSRINTTADEYRPILKYLLGFDNQALIFSSNRAGGKGGFDLYYAGVLNRE